MLEPMFEKWSPDFSTQVNLVLRGRDFVSVRRNSATRWSMRTGVITLFSCKSAMLRHDRLLLRRLRTCLAVSRSSAVDSAANGT